MRAKSVAIWLVVLCLAAVLGARAQQAGQTSTVATPAAGTVVPRLINFSGIIKDSRGEAKTGEVDITFSLYELQDGGPPLWAETQTVQLDSQGRYTVLLGSTHSEGLPLDLFTTGQARWLGVQPALPAVGELPGILLVGVPYALKAADADTLEGKPASAFVAVESRSSSGNATASATARGASPDTSGNRLAVLPLQGSPLTVGGMGTANYIPIWTDSADLGNSIIFQSTAGNVGIGTTSPQGKLHVVDGNAFVRTETNSYPMFMFRGPENSPNGATGRPGRLGLYGATAFLSSNLYYNNTNWVEDNPSYPGALALAQGGNIEFYTLAAGSTNLTSRMGVFESGNVGIGTRAPAAALDVVGSLKLEGSGNGITFPDGSTQTTAEVQGPPGPQGPQGPQGPPGPAVHTSAVCAIGSPSPPACPHGYAAGPQKGPCTVTSDTGSCSGLQDTTGPWGCAVCIP